MRYNFYDDMGMFNNFMPYNNEQLNAMPNSFKDSVNKMNENINMNGFGDMTSSNNSLNMTTNNFDYEMLDDINMYQSNFGNQSTNNLSSSNLTNNLDLYSPYEGYLKGNGFREQYVPYKNYQPHRLNITSERDEMLVNIGQYGFMAHEMNLYLDTHPNDKEALNKFQVFRDKANDLIKDYERKYGPLSVSGNVGNQVPFNWVTEEWPWVN